MSTKSTKLRRQFALEDDYSAFSQLDGRHPWQDQVPEGMILYPARKLPQGKVSYFNFALAKEMGLIGEDHPERMTKKLHQTLINTFSLRIVNEYDQQRGTKFAPETMQTHSYMATRYLQMQHADRTGRTSGDGRCIWNGVVKTAAGEVWDVSSRGTGVTALAPGVVEAGKPLKSGNNDHGYGCGMAEIDELFGAALLAEIFHRNGIPTERVLAVIDLGKGNGIGVRAAPNLLRPAHMFLFLRQERREVLRRSMDYFIERQHANGRWDILAKDPARYDKALEKLAKDYARFAAYLERDYIFAWLDWDGDNVLADAGIIDYGSVRQFGLRHDQYRYDDVSRFSTNLNEQRIKARDTVQTFAQLVHYLKTGTMRKWRKFSQDGMLRTFDQEFKRHCLDRFLYQMGFVESLRRLLLNKFRREVESMYKAHCDLERVKTSKRTRKVADGVHRPAIYNMRNALACMTEHLAGLPVELSAKASDEEFFSWILSSQAAPSDRRLKRSIRAKIQRWQNHYMQLVKKVSSSPTWEVTIASMQVRAKLINSQERITGNALINIVLELLQQRRRGLSDSEIQLAMDQFIAAQTLNPDSHLSSPKKRSTRVSRTDSVMRTFLSVIHGYREDI